ncbi:tripartite tricarboxylate transporter TctB family protein [Chelatococcus reniformis]|uniref:DUF1468 domain-containing protein n=1 Tax=Chelatococcus reniformis TaxID=1494448 RepID=A0A916XMF9_9HYPH|nr:tripartite tricarboxylate transporter TctB family protein [Chelatococcus reniformis]GGC86885.1 hypothetical protein GCM10010994_51010 [Chelatococcus reniformis]
MRLSAFALPAKLTGLGLLLIVLGFGIGALRLSIWQFGMPGPGLTPLLVSIALLPIAAVLVLEPLRPEEREPLQGAPLLTGLAFLAYVALVEYAGFALPTFAFILLWARLLYARSWAVSLATALLMPLALYVLFMLGLGIPLPLWPR